MTVLSNIITPSNVLTTTNTATVTNKTLTSPTVTGMVVSDGTANGVTYLNGSKVLTSGSALVFDGTNLGLGVTPSAWNSSWKVLQFNNGSVASNASVFDFPQNAYFSAGGTYTYTTTAAASLYRQNAGQHAWFNVASGTAGNAITFTQAMTLDASGNLGVGTTSPSAKLHVVGNSVLSSSSDLYFVISKSGVSAFDIYNKGASGTEVGTQDPYPLILKTNNTERARITSGGQVLVGSTTTVVNAGTTQLYVKTTGGDYAGYFETTNTSPYGTYIKYSGAAPNSTGFEFLVCRDTSATRIQLRSNGGFGNYSGNNVNLSDRREKTNFAPATSYLDKICAIPVQTFNYIDQNMEEDGGLTLGVVAQDVQAIAPELVTESNWGTEEAPKMRLSIYQTDLQYALMKCIQEQQAIIESLKARLDAANL